ncbi:hypothetical protein M5K25_012769 [Dendrobium thyrsiflorum]|uniref:RING-type E3 ubiquitin transferase n=1 Tax=Dendrobium thyrsiflorum TaxID=117978 RepID=A0ABD0UXT5_DENTH
MARREEQLCKTAVPPPVEGKTKLDVVVLEGAVIVDLGLRRRAGDSCWKKTSVTVAVNCWKQDQLLVTAGTAAKNRIRKMRRAEFDCWTVGKEEELLREETSCNGMMLAFDLERRTNPGGDMVEDVWQALAKAKYLEWELSSSKRAWRLQKLKDECESALILHQSLQDPQSEDGSQASSDDKVDQFELLNEVFSKALEDDTPREVPDYLCCNITLDIFQDPVITPSGVTYEKAVGNFDPITRQPLDKDELIPNLAIKGAARAFLKEHGWAYKTNPAL